MNAIAPLQRLLSKLNDYHHQWVVTQGETLVRNLEATIAHHSLIGDAPFFDCDRFAWIAPLETQWHIIRAELDQILQRIDALPNFQDISEDQLSITQDDLWKTYFFYAYGLKAEKNCARCPQTTKLIEQIPGMKTAFFSILLPHKHIPEHRGPYKGVLRYHLALKIPQPEISCGLKVGNEIRHWTEGKSLVFDDTFPHEAWNQSDEIRVVLFVDVVRPMRRPIAWLNQFMIQLIAWSPYVQVGKRRFMAWENRLESPQAPEIHI